LKVTVGRQVELKQLPNHILIVGNDSPLLYGLYLPKRSTIMKLFLLYKICRGSFLENTGLKDFGERGGQGMRVRGRFVE